MKETMLKFWDYVSLTRLGEIFLLMLIISVSSCSSSKNVTQDNNPKKEQVSSNRPPRRQISRPIVALKPAKKHGKSKKESNAAALTMAGQKLGMEIEKDDIPELMIAAANWIGVPYRSGSKNKNGTDCSGMSAGIYKEAFNITLSPNSQMQLENDCKMEVEKDEIQQGDLVFFSSKNSKSKINHVGIYLKDSKFIHASSSKGVRVDRIDVGYWKEKWVGSGRVLE